MATKTLKGDCEEYVGTNSKDVIKVYGYNTEVRARNGNDVILINRTDKFRKYDFFKIDAGAGKDKITIKKCAASDIYGGKDNDTIIIQKGFEGNNVYAESGNDTIKIQGGNNLGGKIDAGKGNDSIIISGGKNMEVYGGLGKDTITVSGGNTHFLWAGSGDDVITVKKGNYVYIHGDKGKDNITVSGGKKHNVHIESGDTVTVSGTAKNCEIISSSALKNANLIISGGSKNKFDYYGDSNGKSNYYVNNTVKVSGGSDNIIHNYNSRKNTINVTGGTNNQISSSDDKNLTINVSGKKTTCSIEILNCRGSGSITLKGGKSSVYFGSFESGSSGTFTINAAKGTVSGNKLNYDGSFFNYSHSGNTLIITDVYGNCALKITDFLNGAFSNGFDCDGHITTYAEIKKMAGW